MPADTPRPANEPDHPTRAAADAPASDRNPRLRFSDGTERTWNELELRPDVHTGRDLPGVADHPGRPRPEDIRLTPDRLAHILDGDEYGGGHRHGAGIPGKTEFPESWNDDTIAATVLRAAHRPQQVEQQNNGRWRVNGIYEEVDMRVIVNPDGRIWTAHPIAGPGVTTNPDDQPD